MKNNIRQKYEELKFENEIKKIKLSLEHGAKFMDQTEGNIPPEIESEFLDYVQQFEIAQQNCKSIQVYDFIGRPEYKLLTAIPEASLSDELKRLLDILADNQVFIDTIYEVEEAELYRFITEEFFFEETDDIRIEGMMHCFIYEEFHPNDPKDINRMCNEILERVFDKKSNLDGLDFSLAERVEIDHKVLKKKDFIKKLNEIREFFGSLNLVSLVINSVLVDSDTACAKYEIEYSSKVEGVDKLVSHSGEGEFGLINEYGSWSVNRLSIPGLIEPQNVS
ncbi:MAG: hypothetical protein KA444_10600 [Bacteroidia bacterium]|nr:hypothetical protein [Bacteroidia bacterium]